MSSLLLTTCYAGRLTQTTLTVCNTASSVVARLAQIRPDRPSLASAWRCGNNGPDAGPTSGVSGWMDLAGLQTLRTYFGLAKGKFSPFYRGLLALGRPLLEAIKIFTESLLTFRLTSAILRTKSWITQHSISTKPPDTSPEVLAFSGPPTLAPPRPDWVN